MKVLADADFLVALAKEDDANHAAALSKAAALTDAAVFVTPFTIPEAATVLSYKVSHAAARKFLETARTRFAEIPLDEGLIREADRIFSAERRKGTSWIDCLNVAAVHAYRFDAIASFDRFYRKAGVAMM